ncbi:unnamed protein product [Lactuca virosa]|uniref:Uncharacterized protein n=1 Tax=Lactuca virosa TaxID=75947 RepID=A0AAU9N4A9_9ASTR|nr:unnamed protein product [Lactuca virosa]
MLTSANKYVKRILRFIGAVIFEVSQQRGRLFRRTHPSVSSYIVHLCDFCCQSAYSGFTYIPWFWLPKKKNVHQFLEV